MKGLGYESKGGWELSKWVVLVVVVVVNAHFSIFL